MKKIITLFLALFFLFSASQDVKAQQCTRADILSYRFEDPQPSKPGDDLVLSLQTSPNLYNQTLTISIVNETTSKNLGTTVFPVDAAGRARPSVALTDRGNYRITISGAGGSICFDQTYGFSPQQPTTNSNQSPSLDVTCKDNPNAINTAIGCIPINNTNALVNFILGWALGIAGGIAFLLILVAGFQITTSRGDPNRLKAGQELLTSAIAGLVLLIFSIFILRVIGFNILGITAFGGK